jgi:hypothetical protein
MEMLLSLSQRELGCLPKKLAIVTPC